MYSFAFDLFNPGIYPEMETVINFCFCLSVMFQAAMEHFDY